MGKSLTHLLEKDKKRIKNGYNVTSWPRWIPSFPRQCNLEIALSAYPLLTADSLSVPCLALVLSDKPNKVWDTDVTYLIFKGSRAYLSTIIDLYDRHVVAYKISKHNDNKLVMDTLNEALSKEKDVHGLIIHSDQGFQYTSYEYKAICESNGIQISMSRKGNPIDDSPIESWHSLLKKETLYNNNITSLQEYIQLVEEWILFYNTTRLKSKLKKKRKTYTKREK